MDDLDDLLNRTKEDNDPLANLDFSDDDTEDSFDNKKQEQPIIDGKKLSNLFGIEAENQNDKITDGPTGNLVSAVKETSKENSTLIVTDTSLEKLPQSSKDSNLYNLSADTSITPNRPTTAEKKSKEMKSLFLSDNDDVISNLADKPKAPPSAQSKKSLMEDLFGKETAPNLLTDTSKTKSTFTSSSFATRLNTAESNTGLTNETTSKTSTSLATGYSLSAPKEPRRGRRTSTTILNDPFGYLSASALQFDEVPKAEEKQVAPTLATSESKSAVNEDLPDWLGGPKIVKEHKQENDKPVQSNVVPKTVPVGSPEKVSESIPSTTLTKGVEDMSQSRLTSKLLGMEFNQQAAIINMQQQEHELRTAAALSQQSDKLNYLLEAQKMKLSEQEKQFNALISRQLERQTLIEAQIKAQQDRIDNYIHTLAAQPIALSGMPGASLSVRQNEKNSDETDEKVDAECLLHKEQLEKLCLENTLQSLREQHEREISILEESYKRQITHLEEAIVQMEKRMQDDIECLEADYKAKIQKLKEEISDCQRTHREEKEMLKEENLKLIKEIQDRHHKSLEILQKEHTEIVEKITKSKESERQAVEIMRAEGTNVQIILNKSEVIMKSLENLQNNFDNKDKHFRDLQENHFAVREKNMEYLQELLKTQKEEFNEEKLRLTTTIQKLESDISLLTKEFQKQNVNLQNSEEILKSKEQALLRDRELFIEQTSWERERLKAMMAAWAKEEDKQLEWLAQERQALAVERGKLQIFNRLKPQVDESSKIELEAAIKAAQDAAFKANQERLKWQEKMKELDRKESALEEEENRLIQKAKELQEFTQSAISKREEGLKALKEAHFIEKRYKEKFSQINLQQEILIEKENKLAAEKLELAKARISLHMSEVEEPEKDTDNVYKSNQKKHVEKDLGLESSTEYTTHFKDVVDPHLIMLKWDLEKNLAVSQTTF